MADSKETKEATEAAKERKLTEEEISKIIAERLGNVQSDATLQKELTSLSEEQLLARRDMLSANMQNNIVEAEMFARMGQMAQAAKAYAAAQESHKQLLKQLELSITNKKDLQLELEEAMAGGNPKSIAAAKQKIKQAQELRDLLDEELADSEERLNLDKATAAYRNLSEAGKKVHNEAVGHLEAVGGLLFGLTKAQNTMVGSGLMFVNTLLKARKAGEGLGTAFKEVFSLSNVGASLAEKVVESFVGMFLAVDAASTKFAAATGTGNQYTGMIEDLRKEQEAHLGVSMENNTQALQGLLEGMIGFTHMSKEAQANITAQVAQFDRLGVSGEQAADLMNTFGSIMGATARESVDLTRELTLMGGSVGISSQRMIKDFQQAQKTLAVYGKQSVGIFENMAAAAKAAGVEMGTLLGMAGKFDTFEDAADSTAKLNAILGSNLSSTRMLMMTEDERIETLIQQVQMSGQSFAQMDRFKQKAIANAAGITDMAEANKIFGMSMSKYRSHVNEMKKVDTSQKAMQEAIKATVPIQEMLANMMVQFAPDVTAALEVVRGMIEFVSATLKKLNDISGGTFLAFVWIGTVTAAIGILGPPLAAVAKTAKLAGGALGVVGKGAAKAGKAAGGSGKSVGMFMKHMAGGLRAMAKNVGAVPVLLSIGAAAVMVGYGVSIAAKGIAELVMSFVGLSGPQALAAVAVVGLMTIAFVAFFAVMAAAIYTGVGPAAAGIMLAIGAGAFLMGAGIAVAALGMSVLVKAIASMGADGVIAAGAFMLIAQGMALMLLSAAALAMALYFAIPAIAGVSVTSMGAGIAIAIMAVSLGLAAIVAEVFGPALLVIAEGLVAVMASGGGAAGMFAALGLSMVAMAAGLGAMFLFVSNPLGWLAIAAAMGVMSGALYVLVKGINSISEEKLVAIGQLSSAFAALSDMDGEQTIVAKVTSDLENFKETMDASIMAQVASLSTFNDVRAINNTRAETSVQNQMQMPDKIVVEATNTIHTQIGDKDFTTHVKKAVNNAKWGTYDPATKAIVAAGNA